MTNELLSGILDREFRRLAEERRAEGNAPDFGTLGKQAQFLGVNKSTLSRLRNGRVRLNPGLARGFSEKLRLDAGERESLRRELEAAGSPQENPGPLNIEELLQTGDVHSAKELFKRLANNGSFVGVEYRDLPRADPTGKYRVYAEFAGEAIAQGLSFAMFQPFGDADRTKEDSQVASEENAETHNYHHTKLVRDYIWNLRKKVREVYLAMLKAALKSAQSSKPDGVKLTYAEKLKVAAKLVLYERGTDEHDKFRYNFCSGIQSRLFYAEIQQAETVEREVWEWVAAPSRDFFVPRDESTMPRDVIAEQLFPVLHFWRDNNNRLPRTPQEIAETIAKYNPRLEANLPKWIWKVYMPPQGDLDAVLNC